VKERTKTGERSKSKAGSSNRDMEPRESGWTVSSITDTPVGTTRRKSVAKRSGSRTLHVRRRDSRHWLKIVQLVCLATAIGGWSYFLLTNSRFAIRQIHIDGIQTVDVSQIAAAAEVPRNSNIFIFVIEERNQFCAHIKACDPAIKDASVAIDFPNALRLDITERQPYAVLRLANGTTFMMDPDRVPYRMIAMNQTQSPIIAVPPTQSTCTEGQPLPQDINDHVATAYSALSLVSQRQIGPLSDLQEVFVDRYDNVSFRMRNQLIVKLGQADGMPQRLSTAETLLAADPGLITKAKYLDFTSSRPALLLKSGSPGGLPISSIASTSSTPLINPLTR
jgi:hypothetical protein